MRCLADFGSLRCFVCHDSYDPFSDGVCMASTLSYLVALRLAVFVMALFVYSLKYLRQQFSSCIAILATDMFDQEGQLRDARDAPIAMYSRFN